MEMPVRKRRRMPEFDYSSENYYYVTICTQDKKHLFWKNGQMNSLGRIAEQILRSVPEHRKSVRIDKYAIMPNHIHAIIVIGCDPEHKSTDKLPTLSNVVGSYKSAVTKEIHKFSPNAAVWQESFYEHVIRNEHDYSNIWLYIDENPRRWEEDEYF